MITFQHLGWGEKIVDHLEHGLITPEEAKQEIRELMASVVLTTPKV